MKRVYVKIKNIEITIPCFSNRIANLIHKVADKLGQKYDIMYYQTYILED